MKDWTPIRERYLRDQLPVRLGGLAANLSRINSFSSQEASRDAVEGLLDESKYFIEWTAAEVEVNTAAQLIELQVQLARWQHNWTETWGNPLRRKQMAEQSAAWSQRVLALSGLLNR